MNVRQLSTVMLVSLFVLALSQAASAQDVNKIYVQAKQAKSAKEYDKAVELYKKVLDLSPDFSTGYYELGCVHALKGDKSKALDNLKTAVEKGYLYFERMKNDPDLKKVRSHKDFKAILKDRNKYIKKAADKTEQHWKNKLGGSFQFDRDDKYKFIIAYEVSAAQKQNVVRHLHLTVASHAKHLFKKKPDYYISVVICKGAQSFTALLGAAYTRAAGVYIHAHKTLYVRADTGIGTPIHEFTHALHWADALARKQDMQPQWVLEGFGTLYESPTFTKSGELRCHLSYQHHWRLPGLQKSIRDGTYKGLKNLFYRWSAINIGHAYQMAKYLFLYLQEEGLLYKFYEEYVKTYPDNPTATNTTAAAVKALEKVVGKKIDKFEPEWKEWVLSINKPMMGVYFDQKYEGKGARVEKVQEGSPAEQGGMKPNDIILEMDGKPVKDYNANQELLKSKKRGEEVVFTVKRADKEIKLTLKLGTWPKK